MTARPLSKALKAKTTPGLLLDWALQVLALTLAPIIVYVVAYSVLGKPLANVLRLREWLLIAIVLLGADIRVSMVSYRNLRKSATRVKRHIALGRLGILIASILLCFSIIETNRPDLIEIPPAFYYLQFALIVYALFSSAVNAVLTEMQRTDAHRKALLIEDEDIALEVNIPDYSHIEGSIEAALLRKTGGTSD